MNLPCNRYKYTYVKNVLGQRIQIQYEYMYIKTSSGIRNVFIPACMVLYLIIASIFSLLGVN